MLPRVVLTPLKVNGAHMESASGEHCFCCGDFLMTAQLAFNQQSLVIYNFARGFLQHLVRMHVTVENCVYV